MRGLYFAGFALAVVLAAPPTAGAQAPDRHWNDWVGCWNLIADGSMARLPQAEEAQGGVTGPIRPGGSRSARVCVSHSQGGAELRTFVGDQQVLTQTIVADGLDHPVSDGGCSGTQRARWSEDGLRLFTRAQVTCENQPSRTVTGIALIAPDGQWVDVQAVTINGTDSVRVRRFGPPLERSQKGVPTAAVRLQVEHVKEATKYVSPRAIEAALMETSSRFPLSSRVLVDLDKAGVDDRVIDLMVALSFPRSFAVRPSAPDDRLTPFPPLFPGGPADFVDASYEYPYFYGPYYSNYYYSPYFFSPFGYSYLRYYGYGSFGGYPPVAVIVPGGGGEIDRGDRPLPPENGRAVKGFGYTQVDRRGDGASSGGAGGDVGGGGGSLRSGGGSRATASPQGYVDRGSSSSSSSGGSSGGAASSSSGGSSSGSSGGGGGDSGRTAVPR
ncbi:MAG TPA: hypothetical protein VFO31_04160 [Vicinamibacterales bacterium]|nr:hypothetical protein [Vicinamibacterales bacterium]